SVVVESLVIGVIGSVTGLFLGLLIAKLLNALLTAVGIDLPQTGTVLATRTIVVSLLVGVLVTLLASLRPALRATRVPPLASVLGWPATKIGGAAGSMARDNAMRNPSRTASTAAAVMIGLGLVTFVALLGQGLRTSFESAVNQLFVGDYALTATSTFQP